MFTIPDNSKKGKRLDVELFDSLLHTHKLSIHLCSRCCCVFIVNLATWMSCPTTTDYQECKFLLGASDRRTKQYAYLLFGH